MDLFEKINTLIYISQSKGVYECASCKEYYGVMNCADKREMGRCLNCGFIIGGNLVSESNADLFKNEKKVKVDKRNKKIKIQDFKKIIGNQIMQFFRENYHFHTHLIQSDTYFGIPNQIFYMFYLFYHVQYLLIGLIHKQSPVSGFDAFFSNKFSFGIANILF